jgi:hypothetical protein
MVVIKKTRGLRPPFPPDEDERRGAPGGLEKGLEGVLFISLYLEKIPLGIFSHRDQPIRLLSLSVDATSVHREKDPERQPKISNPFILKPDIHILSEDIA